MKKNKYIILVSLLVLVTVCLFFNYKKDNKQIFFIREEVATKTETQNNLQNINISLKTPDKSYLVKVEEGATALDVMKNAQNSGFSFNGKEYPGMGYFIDEINGVKSENGKYWIYYINEQEAEIGVSKYVVNNGDIINWKLK